MKSPSATARAAGQPAATAQAQRRTSGTHGHAASNGHSGRSGGGLRAALAQGWASRYALKNWRVRSRLLLLISIPTLTAVVLGGIRIASSVQSAYASQRVETLASLGQEITVLGQALEDERDQIVFYIAMGADGGRVNGLSADPAVRSKAALELSVVDRAFSSTDQAASRVRAVAGQIDGSYSAQTQQAAATALTALNGLRFLRSSSIETDLPLLVVVQKYTGVIDDVLALQDQNGQGSSDPTLAQTGHVLALVSAMEEEASEQRAILAAALLQGKFGPGQLAALDAAQSAQQSNQAAFTIAASVGQRLAWNNSVDGSFVYLANSEELQAISLAGSVGSLRSDPTTPVDWFGAMSNTIDYQMGSFERQQAAAFASRAAALRDSAITSAALYGVAVLLVLLLALMLITVVARSMVRPLHRLRTGALEVAGQRLPEAVRRMSETDGEGVPLEVEPIDVDSSDEIGEVARAFDQVHREALRLAANEAALRGNVNAMFVNLSRRSQSLVERQIRLIDDLEQGEQDPERLSSLFQMDHLATRMRRNSENLLVLAGHEESRRWNQPVALVDVLRAALSEIEQYERVSVNVQAGIAVRGQAVSDVVHLTAELIENATSFSPAETPVTIAGHLLSSGGALLEITDHGVGMEAEEMAHANWRLDNPPVVDVAVSRRMGLFVVARLAARHGIRVRLRPSGSGGLVALVWLPDEAIMHEAPDGSADQRGGAAVPEPVIGPITDGAFAGSNGAFASAWSGADRGTTADQAEQATSAAKPPPTFAPLRADAEGPGLGPKRVPGAGPRPGSSGWGTTGPLPAFRTVPRPASNGDSEPAVTEPPAVTGPQPVLGAGPVASVGPAAGSDADTPAAAEDSDSPAIVVFDSFATGSQPSDGGPDAAATTSLRPVLGTPAATWEASTSRGAVIVPPADGLGKEHRLPIFEAVESDWFRRGRQAVGRPGGHDGAEAGNGGNGWSSPADEGWRAAEVVHAPSSGGVTSAGLPKRVPRANLVPGAATAATASAAAPARSAAATRDRFASFQRGAREGRADGRAAASETGTNGGESESSE
jgi:signal transduction histidine kinase